ncbi:hypothetical protein Q4508_06865 [Amphritea sp. 2_MG-2023]|uniref:hypothetical protein n=1 Tax=Amphritea TaxID=515417 RepID=UPI001C076918|nr:MULTISPECIES: hypothetical protein [Amphritea]MBU2967465.1 hypothetical protein [Amphritea atlantica]MDO6418280.1 hypothetical protein [Amphritea sp. 2_MG-2023]
MRDQDKDLELPSFGPAERELHINAPGEHAQPEPSANSGHPTAKADSQKKSSGGNALSYLIILLLAVAVGGLAYWSFLQHQQLLALEAERVVVDEKIIELQKLFLVAGNSAAQTGETLQSQVEKQAVTNQEQFVKLNADVAKSQSEIAKLWVVAHQQNTPKLAKLETQLKGALAQVDTQTKALSDVSSHVAQLEKQLKVATAKESDNSKQVVAVRQSASALSTEFQILTESIERQQAEQSKEMAALAQQVKALKSDQGSAAGLERRIRVNEQAVKAIDGSRLQMNKELLQIRQKLNNLQLKVEKL